MITWTPLSHLAQQRRKLLKRTRCPAPLAPRLFAAAALAVAFVYSSAVPVMAASAYDNAYRTTDYMVLDDDGAYYGDCLAQEAIQSNWYSLGLNAPRVNNSTATVDLSARASAYERLDAAVADGTMWSVSYGAYTASTGTTLRKIYVTWLNPDYNTDTVNVVWSTGQNGTTQLTTSPTAGHLEGFAISLYEGTANMTGQNCLVNVDTNTMLDVLTLNSTADNGTGSSSRFIRNFFVSGSSVNFNYPTGYAGTPIRPEAPDTPPDTSNPAWLTFSYDVASLTATLKNTTDTAAIPVGVNACMWHVDNDPSPIGDNTGLNASQYDEAFPCSSEIVHKFSEFGVYAVTLYMWGDGNTYTAYDEFTIDGTSYAGSVGAGGKVDKSIYEDCSTFGTDFGAAFGCHLRNFGTMLKTMLHQLFIPSSLEMKQQLDENSAFMTQKLGFLAFPFTFLSDLFASFSGNGSWCSESSCSISAPVMYGGTLSLDFLYLKHSNFAEAWDYGVAVIRGMTVLGIIYAVQRKYMEFVTK